MSAAHPLDRKATPLGEILLRRVQVPHAAATGGPGAAWEILLDGALLVTSLVDVGERALAERTLAAAAGDALDVLVGGLGLGATAVTALEDPRVASVVVLEKLDTVVTWHYERRVPHAARLLDDARCTLLVGDFFTLMSQPGPRYDVILLDVDHSPRAHLCSAHADFYTEAGLARLRERLRPGGVFGLWSGDAEDPAFLARLRAVFDEARAETVRFYNLQARGEDLNTIYVAT